MSARSNRFAKQQMTDELVKLRQRVASLEKSEAEQRAAAEELRLVAEKYRSIFDNAVEGIFQSTPEGRFLMVNPTIAAILGFLSPEDTLRGVSDIRHLYVHPEDRAEFKRLMAEQGGVVRGFETQVYRKDRSTIWTSLSAKAVCDKGGTVAYYEGTIEDITVRKQREREVAAIAALGAALRGVPGRGDMLAVILRHVGELMKAEEVALVMRDPASGVTVIELAEGKWRERSGFRLPPGEGVIGQAITIHKMCLRMKRFDDGRLDGAEPDGELDAVVSVPLLVRGEVIGAFWIGGNRDIGADEVHLLSAISEMAANAIHRATLHDQLILAYDTTIEGWSRALDMRDKETEGHSLRVTEMTLRLARAVGISDADLVHVRRGALLHDIGKMGIPDNILLKPACLTAGEWEIMRRHPCYAHEMLSPVDFLRAALDIPHCHHEKWDGSGYPRGLKGEHIPLLARVFTIVDVWDALRSDRPYRSSWPEEKVRSHIYRESGRQFDPGVVDLFLRMDF
jgi:PAS domain S-box-containing protein/putative nucleotidyltransferase with HDIG domain